MVLHFTQITSFLIQKYPTKLYIMMSLGRHWAEIFKKQFLQILHKFYSVWMDRKYVIIETRHDKWYAELSSKCFRRISKLISLKYDSGEHDLMQS